MKVFVGYASKHGATDEMAHEIGRVLSELGHDVTTAGLDKAPVDDYDAYVLGSGIYAGNWLKSARQFVKKHHAHLLNSRVWLFSSGPVGRPLMPEGEPESVADLLKSISPEEHVVFAGKLARDRLNLLEKAVVTVFHAPDGDFRDWEAVRRWALEIGDALGKKAEVEVGRSS